MCPSCTQSLDSVYLSDLFIGNDRDIVFFLHRCESANDKGMALNQKPQLFPDLYFKKESQAWEHNLNNVL